eukprot:CCRYP_003657-RA/>CCRYP_003657-RA protein AED:0.04 eAED:0.04 QI:186/0.9/1/1/0.7/0.63/11/5768/717
MDEPEFCSERITTDIGTWEYDGDTGNIVYPHLFDDDVIVPSPDHEDRSHLSLASTDDGAFTTITTLGEAIIQAKSTFEVVEIDTSSCCVSDSLRSAYDGTNDNSEVAGGDAMLHWALSSQDKSPRTKSSFPEGSIVLGHEHSGPRDDKGGQSLSPDRQGLIIQDDNQDPCACDRSTAVSSLTHNDSFFPLRLFSPKDCVGVVFDPFLEAMRPPPTSAPDGIKRFNSEIKGWNRFMSSTRNLKSIFRPHPKCDLHMHRAQLSSVLPTSCSPEHLVITTTHSHLTPSVCSDSSGNNNIRFARAPSLSESNASHTHSISQLFTNELRERYPSAVLRSYQRHYYPSFWSRKAFVDEGAERKPRRIYWLVLCLASLLAGIISITVVATRRDIEVMTNELYELSSVDKLHHESEQGNGSLPNACCLEGMDYLDEVIGGADNAEKEPEGISQAGTVIIIRDENTSSGDISDGGTGHIVSLASSQNNDPPIATTYPSPTIPSPELNRTASIEDAISPKLSPLTDAPTNFLTVDPSFHYTNAQTFSNAYPPSVVDIAPNQPQPTHHTSPNPTNKPTPRPSSELSTRNPSIPPSERPMRQPRTKSPINRPSERPTPLPVVRLPSELATDVPTLSQINLPTFLPTVLPPILLNESRAPSLRPSYSESHNETGSEGPAGLTKSPSVHAVPYSPSSSPLEVPQDDPASSPTNIFTSQPSTSPLSVGNNSN